MYGAVSAFPSQVLSCDALLNTPRCRSGLQRLSEYRKSSWSGLRRVTFCGMGGSAFPMELLRVWLRDTLHVDIHRDYADELPTIRTDTLYVMLSFSGNTEEVLDCAASIVESDGQICVVTAGGKLGEWADRLDVLKIGFPSLPAGFQPRCASGYFIGTIAGLLDGVGLTQGLFEQVKSGFALILAQRESLELRAQSLAGSMLGRRTFLLGYPEMAETVGTIGRIKFNENAKAQVLCDSLPEFNHNQMVAMGLEDSSAVTVVLLQDDRVGGRRLHRLKACEAYFEACGVNVEVVNLVNMDMFASALAGMWVLDFASLFLAEKKGVDPQEIEVIESFKALLNR